MVNLQVIMVIIICNAYASVIGFLITQKSRYPAITPDSKNNTEEDCICMPFTQCKESFKEYLNDPYFFDKRTKRSPTCSGYLDTCCKVECGVPESPSDQTPQIKILGNPDSAAFGEFPWMVGILKGVVFMCGGSLIHPKVVLTAAHCVSSPGEYTVRAGEWDWEHKNEPKPHQDQVPEIIISHPNFNPSSLVNDIALLILKGSFQLASNVGIVCLPPKHLEVDTRRCTTLGWGQNSYRKGSFQSLLRKLDLPIVPRAECLNTLREVALGPYFTLDESFLCAGGEYMKDTSKGDGGGPLICPVNKQNRYEQVGIVSWGLIRKNKDSPGVYVNVVLFRDWIDEKLTELNLNSKIYRYY